MHQPVLVIVAVAVCAFIVHADGPVRDTVRLLRQPAVTVIAVQVLCILRDAVIRPYFSAAVRIKLRVRQTIARRVGGVREADIQTVRSHAHAGEPAGLAVVVFPGLARGADAGQMPGPVIPVVAVQKRTVQVPAQQLSGRAVTGGECIFAETALCLPVQAVAGEVDKRCVAELHPRQITAAVSQPGHRGKVVGRGFIRQSVLIIVLREVLPQ
ncbi:hypothetical protein CIPOMA221M_25035 [Citrobacter portucalensis]